VLYVTPTLARLFGDGGWSVVTGVVLAFVTDWVVLAAALAWVYRVVAPERPGWAAVAWGAAGTGSFLAGFVQGFVLFLAIPVDLGLPFGGLTAIGAAVAVAFWLFMLHLVTLVGHAATRCLDARLRAGSAPAAPGFAAAAGGALSRHGGRVDG
jgi:membrane protein